MNENPHYLIESLHFSVHKRGNKMSGVFAFGERVSVYCRHTGYFLLAIGWVLDEILGK